MREGPWSAVVRACPRHAHWLEGEAITDILPMGGVTDRYRRFVVEGRPVATGVAAVGDAWACTNPFRGHGIALGLVHMQRLRDVVRERLETPTELARAWDAVTEAELIPWYRETVDTDRERMREIEALRLGVEPAAPTDPRGLLGAALPLAARHDADVFRAMLELLGCLSPASVVLARPGLAERILEHDSPPLPGPDRHELLRLAA